MVEVTIEAAQQILKSAREAKMEDAPLRVAATKNPDDSIHYGMGFDDVGSEIGKDHQFSSNGITVVVNDASLPLVDGMTIDYAEIENGQFHFVFLNPNDPNYQPAEKK